MIRRVWEITYERPNGDWVWFRTEPITFREAVLEAITKEIEPRYAGPLISIIPIGAPVP